MQIFPPSMDPVTEAIGRSAAVSFVRVHGGTRVYIPLAQNLGDEHPICRLLGRPLAEKLCRALGGEYVAVPRVIAIERIERDRIILERVESGDSYGTIARDLQLTERCVHSVVAKSRAEAA